MNSVVCWLVANLAFGIVFVSGCSKYSESARSTNAADTGSDYASRLKNAERLEQFGRLGQALSLKQQLLNDIDSDSGHASHDAIEVLISIGRTQLQIGSVDEAEKSFEDARDRLAGVKETQQIDYALALHALADIRTTKGNYKSAEELFLESLRLRAMFAQQRPELIAESHFYLGDFYRRWGKLQKAEFHAAKALELRRTLFDEESQQVAIALNNLGLIYSEMCRYELAEKLLKQAIEIHNRRDKTNPRELAICLNNLGLVYFQMGSLAQAEPLLRHALEINLQTQGADSTDTALQFNNLAAICIELKRFDDALELMKVSLEIHKRRYGEQHPQHAQSLSNYGTTLLRKGLTKEAESYLEQASKLYQATLGEDSFEYVLTRLNLAELAAKNGEFSKAEAFIAESIQQFEQHPSYPPDHYLRALDRLSRIYLLNGKTDQARETAKRMVLQSISTGYRVIPGLPESRAHRFSATLPRVGGVLSALSECPENELYEIYSILSYRRGIVGELTSIKRRLAKNSTEGQKLLDQLFDVQQELAELTLRQSSTDQVSSKPIKTRIAEANRRKELLESQLLKVSPMSRQDGLTPEIDIAVARKIQASLPAESAVIEYFKSTVKDETGNEWVPAYCCFVMTNSDITFKVLGEAREIDGGISDWRKKIAEGTYEEERSAAKKISKLIWNPFESFVTGQHRLYVIPDGDLMYIPFAALTIGDLGDIVLHKHTLTTMGNIRQLLDTKDRTEKSTQAGFALIGDAFYDSSPGVTTTATNKSKDAKLPSSVSRAAIDSAKKVFWPRLPQTRNEILGIKKLLPTKTRLKLLLGTAATESSVLNSLPGNRYIHIATHGFFADEQFRSNVQGAYHVNVFETRRSHFPDQLMTEEQGSVFFRNPMILSGLVFSGANQSFAGKSSSNIFRDGIITAEEIVSLNLMGTDLVVLSACNTGLGRTGNGEGVFGLQRAFHMAGSQNVIASLWEVDDRATSVLMQMFYNSILKEGKSPPNALRDAQLGMLRKGKNLLADSNSRGIDVNNPIPLSTGTGGKFSSNESSDIPIRFWAAWALYGNTIPD